MMVKQIRESRSYRGMLQSDDGVITRMIERKRNQIVFETAFGLSGHMIRRLLDQPEHMVFSERSRLARLGIQITADPPTAGQLDGDQLIMRQSASAVIPGYPSLKQLHAFFVEGLPVGRMVFCDPDSLLSSEEVMAAIERAELKLPASAAISSDGSIVITPHKVQCDLSRHVGETLFGRILLSEDGREVLGRYQVSRSVPNLIIPPGKGVITTCSMYLNDHYVVLQSGFALGRNLPATVLDPIKTRGIRIYLEIVNGSTHTIVNPLISARVYGAPKHRQAERRKSGDVQDHTYSYAQIKALEKKLLQSKARTCHFLHKPLAVVKPSYGGLGKAKVAHNGPGRSCDLSSAHCARARNDFSSDSHCPHVYATSRLNRMVGKSPATLVLKYFPNLIEHRDIINLAMQGRVKAIYFLEASCEHGPFLSQEDHSRLQEYHAFGVAVHWVCSLNRKRMVHTMRDGKGYFVVPDRLADFHKSMLFAFYGSNLPLSSGGEKRLGALMDALVRFWGRSIGIVTGGGSGVMAVANTMARQRGILSGANYLDITDQSMTTAVDFCQVFQATCRHSRQKWFEITSFPIFNVGGLGTLEELGITLCNMKLAIMERVPIVFFDTEGETRYWEGMRRQIAAMVTAARAPEWVQDHLVITGDPEVVIDAYRTQLQLF